MMSDEPNGGGAYNALLMKYKVRMEKPEQVALVTAMGSGTEPISPVALAVLTVGAEVCEMLGAVLYEIHTLRVITCGEVQQAMSKSGIVLPRRQ